LLCKGLRRVLAPVSDSLSFLWCFARSLLLPLLPPLPLPLKRGDQYSTAAAWEEEAACC